MWKKIIDGVYFIPKKTLLNSTIGPNADMVARYRFISKGDNIDGFYGGNSFANQIGITTNGFVDIFIVNTIFETYLKSCCTVATITMRGNVLIWWAAKSGNIVK